MKKLLAVATIGVVGYLVVKKIKERKDNDVVEVNEEMKNEEVVENAEEEIVVDNDEAIEVEIVDNMEVEENNVFNKIKDLVKAPIKLLIKAFGIVGKILVNINDKLEENARKEIEYYKNEYVYKDDIMHKVLDFLDEIRLSVRIYVVTMNRYMMLGILAICNLLNKLI